MFLDIKRLRKNVANKPTNLYKLSTYYVGFETFCYHLIIVLQIRVFWKSFVVLYSLQICEYLVNKCLCD